MGSTGRSVKKATSATGSRAKSGYTTRITGATGRKVEVYSRNKAQAEKTARTARAAGSKATTRKGRRRTS